MDFQSSSATFKQSDRVGIGKAVWQFLYDAANRFTSVHFDVIHLTRNLPLDPGKYQHASRLSN